MGTIIGASSFLDIIYGGKSASPANISNNTIAKPLTKAELAKLPPWDTRQPKINPSVEVRKIMSSKSVFDSGAAKLKTLKLSDETDKQKLFEIHKAMNRLSLLAKEGAKSSLIQSTRNKYNEKFKAGLKEVDNYLSGLKLKNADLIKGLRNDKLETKLFKPISGIINGDKIQVGGADDQVDSFLNASPFDITIDSGTGPVTINIDLNEMGDTTRSLNNVANFINSKISDAGFSSHFNVVKSFNSTTATYDWNLDFVKTTGEDVTLPNTGNPPANGIYPSSSNLLTNTEFTDKSNQTTNYGANGGVWADVTDWTAASGMEIWNDPAAQRTGIVEVDTGNGVNSFSTSFNTIAGQNYDFKFDFKGTETGTSSASKSFEVLLNGTVINTISPQDADVWHAGNISITGTGGNDQITIRELAGGSGVNDDASGTLFDNIRLSESGSVDDTGRTYGANLVQNGDFEVLDVGLFTSVAGSGWQTVDGNAEIWSQGFEPGGPATANGHFAELDNDAQMDFFTQNIQTEAGKTYQLDFTHAIRTTNGDGTPLADLGKDLESSNIMEVLWNGNVIGTVRGNDDGTWTGDRFDVVGTGGTDQLQFREQSKSNDYLGPFIDDIRLREVVSEDTSGSGSGGIDLLGINTGSFTDSASTKLIDIAGS